MPSRVVPSENEGTPCVRVVVVHIPCVLTVCVCVTFVTCEVRVCGLRCRSGSSLYIYRVYLLADYHGGERGKFGHRIRPRGMTRSLTCDQE